MAKRFPFLADIVKDHEIFHENAIADDVIIVNIEDRIFIKRYLQVSDRSLQWGEAFKVFHQLGLAIVARSTTHDCLLECRINWGATLQHNGCGSGWGFLQGRDNVRDVSCSSRKPV